MSDDKWGKDADIVADIRRAKKAVDESIGRRPLSELEKKMVGRDKKVVMKLLRQHFENEGEEDHGKE